MSDEHVGVPGQFGIRPTSRKQVESADKTRVEVFYGSTSCPLRLNTTRKSHSSTAGRVM